MAGYTAALRLVDGATLKAMRHAVRGDVRHFEPPTSPDAALVDCVEHPFESVPDAADRLADLETRLRERDDRRAVFLTIYVRMTRAVQDGIIGGRFADPDWMRTYLVTFADYYRRAFLAFERGILEAVPDPWRIAFGTAVRGDALIAQDAYLGVNAHINYDLALSLADVGIDPHRDRKYDDHRRINEILTRLVDVQQAALAKLYASGLRDVDRALGRIDEAVTLFSMADGREHAWRIAEVLTDVAVPPITSAARWVLRARATGSGFFIRGPRLDPAVEAVLREVEAEGMDLEWALERIAERLDAEG